MMTIGYETEVILPVSFHGGENDPIRADRAFGRRSRSESARNVCIPVTFAVSGVLPPNRRGRTPPSAPPSPTGR